MDKTRVTTMELIREVSELTGLPEEDVMTVVSVLLDRVKKHLRSGKRVLLAGLATLEIRKVQKMNLHDRAVRWTYQGSLRMTKKFREFLKGVGHESE